MKVDYSPAAIAARLRAVAEMTDYRPENRLRTKIDYSPEGIRSRLDEVSRLLALCRALESKAG